MFIAAKAMPTAKQIELIDKYKFAKVALNKTPKIFVVHVVALETLTKMTIHLFQVAEVLQKRAQLAAL